jgi:hypothetical protein
MKNLGKLNINTEKMMNSDELVRLNGGADSFGECGAGFATWYCTITLQTEGAQLQLPTGIVCAAPGQDPVALVTNTYPDAILVTCTYGGGAPN